jgi:hypothetical protein
MSKTFWHKPCESYQDFWWLIGGLILQKGGEKKIMRSYRFGIELETLVPREKFEDFVTKCNNLRLISGNDGSITAPRDMVGLEIKTRPLNFEKLAVLTRKIQKLCDDNGVTVNTSCGFHIHTSSRRFFRRRSLRHIMMTWVAMEDVLYATQPESRLSNRYCQRRLFDLVQQNGLPQMPKEKDALVDFLGGCDRYYSLNIASLRKHGTLEVRLHAGTTNATKVIMWMTLVRSIFEYAIGEYNQKEVKALFEMASTEEKVNIVWEMLKLPAKCREFYSTRIQKFMLPRLAEQQATAVKIMSGTKIYEKAQRKYKKAENELSVIRRERDNLMSRMRNM